MMKVVKQNFIPILSIGTFIALPLVYWHSKGECDAIYVQCISAGVVLFFGYFNYRFQKETTEINRLSKIPALNVNKYMLEEERTIHIENTYNYPAKNVYIGSFLFTKDAMKHEILYDEIQAQIIKCYPVSQSDILRENFRKNFEEEDKKTENYKSTLKHRIKTFIFDNNKDNSEIYVVIALRSQIMNNNETLLFFFECKYSNPNALLDTLSFTSKHFSIKEQLYEKTLKEINNRYEKYRKKYNKI